MRRRMRGFLPQPHRPKCQEYSKHYSRGVVRGSRWCTRQYKCAHCITANKCSSKWDIWEERNNTGCGSNSGAFRFGLRAWHFFFLKQKSLRQWLKPASLYHWSTCPSTLFYFYKETFWLTLEGIRYYYLLLKSIWGVVQTHLRNHSSLSNYSICTKPDHGPNKHRSCHLGLEPFILHEPLQTHQHPFQPSGI